MPENEKNIPPISKPDAPKPIQSAEDQTAKPTQSFKSYMKEGEVTPQQKTSTHPSPIDLVSQGGTKTLANPTPDSILQQINSTSSALGDVQQQLHKRKGKNRSTRLTPSQKHLLHNKLTNANEMLHNVTDKLGIPTSLPSVPLSRHNPLNKFLSLMEDGETQLNLAKSRLQTLSTNDETPLHPLELISIQMTLTKAQQELEYSSVLLSNFVSGIKTIQNIQL